MTKLGKGTLAAIVLSSMTMGAVGAWIFAPWAGDAATSSTTSPGASNGTHAFHSNEDPNHEKAESPQREAAENSGQFHGGWGQGHSNEDPTHEKSESAQREAQEDGGQLPTP